MKRVREEWRVPGDGGIGQGQGRLERVREVWIGPRRIEEGQGMVVRGGECQGGLVRAMEGWRMSGKNGEDQGMVVRGEECQGS